jgi:hypothetical protein
VYDDRPTAGHGSEASAGLYQYGPPCRGKRNDPTAPQLALRSELLDRGEQGRAHVGGPALGGSLERCGECFGHVGVRAIGVDRLNRQTATLFEERQVDGQAIGEIVE